MNAWYDRAFGPWYLKLYPHRDLAEAERVAGTLAAWLPENGPVLDAGCGAGRHMEVLSSRGYSVFGLDRSRHLLDEASRRPGLSGRLVQGDMRELPVSSGSCAAVISMFTSFGYFSSREAHVALLAEFARAVCPGGRLVLDAMNAPAVRKGLVSRSRRTVSGHEVLERRSIRKNQGDEAVVKELIIQTPEGEEIERYEESVSLYDRMELLQLLSKGGWEELASLGDYDGGPWTPEAPRLLVLGEKRGTA